MVAVMLSLLSKGCTIPLRLDNTNLIVINE